MCDVVKSESDDLCASHLKMPSELARLGVISVDSSDLESDHHPSLAWTPGWQHGPFSLLPG